MQDALRKKDNFTKSVIVVFAGTTLVNFFNFLYQLLTAHKLSLNDFAAFNSLLSIFMVIASTLGTIQMIVAKYCAEFYAHNQVDKIRFLLSGLLKKVFILAVLTFLACSLGSVYILGLLKIPSLSCGYILAALLALAWLTPVFLGAVQGLELFGWLASISVITSILKLALTFILVLLGYNIAGALGALLASSLIGIGLFYFPLRRFISIKAKKEDIHPVREYRVANDASNGVNYKEIFSYLFPVAVSYFCFFALVSFDMVLVKYLFSQEDSGLYSLAQIVGKVFLFLPAAISIVMFPRASGLNARDLETAPVLKKSLLYVFGLCVLAILSYNLFPSLVLKILTGRVYQESLLLGRLFSISMSFFALLYVLISYFLSIKDLRFIKYLVFFTWLQFLGIGLFHRTLQEVQAVLCINAILLFFIHLALLGFKKATCRT